MGIRRRDSQIPMPSWLTTTLAATAGPSCAYRLEPGLEPTRGCATLVMRPSAWGANDAGPVRWFTGYRQA